jgi:hypothetical protein
MTPVSDLAVTPTRIGVGVGIGIGIELFKVMITESNRII